MEQQQGVSLVEILIAVVILGLAAIPIWVLFLHSSDTVQVGQQENIVITIASSFAAQIRNLPAATGPSANGRVPLVYSPAGRYHLGGAAANQVTLPAWNPDTFSFAFEVEDSLPIPGGHKIYIFHAAWKGRLGGMRELSLPTVVLNEPQ
jgi:prepilin-type N-terminal cleavage/methylation domain-containing protein